MNYAIIAAGEGSRLVNEGISTPKPLVKLNGVPMIGRLISIFDNIGAESISIIVNEEMTEVKQYIDTLSTRCTLRTVVKTTASSMHSFYELSKVMPQGKFCLTTVDTIFRADDFARYISEWENATDIDGLMAVTPFIDDEKPLYVEVDESMAITAFADARPEKPKYISGGVYALTSSAFTVLEQCILNGTTRMRNFQRALLSSGLHIKAYPIAKIVDVDHSGDIATATKFILQQ